MPEIVIDDMQDGYREWVDYVRMNGKERSPRGIPTVNVRDLTVILRNPERSLTEHIGRKASTRLAALEALQLVAERSYPDIMCRVAPNTAQFLNVYGNFNGAYGDRIAGATELVINRLRTDHETRQAVLTIFDTKRDLGLLDNRDVACTVALLFEISGGALHCKATMRSNDVMWGVAHDVFMFTTLQRTLAAFVGVDVGEYRHNAYSSHFYLRDTELADTMHASTKESWARPHLCPLPVRGNSWADVRNHARTIIECGVASDIDLSWWAETAKTWQ